MEMNNRSDGRVHIGKNMRITGLLASREYVRRFGCLTEIDRWIAVDLKDGLLEFDPDTEKLYVTALGDQYLDGCRLH